MKTLACMLAAALVAPAAAQTVLFDFENAPLHTSLPIDLTVDGVQAHFAGTGENFSIQWADTMGFTPDGFAGRCIYPNSVFRADLLVDFDQPMIDFSILYAAQELDCDDSSTMRVTVYLAGAEAGTATMKAEPNRTWPSATLSISAPGGFDSAVVHYDKAPGGGCDYGVIFMADDMRVTPAPIPPCYPDFTEDGVLDLFDFLAYVNTFNAGGPGADCDADGGLDLFDFLCFVNAFNVGC
jgi:hypothetical protein